MHRKQRTLVIFDCDGVLVDSEILACSLRVDQLRSYGIKISLKKFVRQFIGRSAQDNQHVIEEMYGVKLPPTYQSDYKEVLLQEFRGEKLRPIKGIATVLSRYNFKAVASNGSMEKILTSLASTDLAKYFAPENIFSAENVAAPKPDPALFLKVCDSLGVPPVEAIVVEDSVSGLEAAAAAGIPSIGFTGGSHFLEAEQIELIKDKCTLGVCRTADELNCLLDNFIG